MGWGPRGDVAKRQAQIVFVHQIGGDFLVDDSFENRLFAHLHSPTSSDTADMRSAEIRLA